MRSGPASTSRPPSPSSETRANENLKVRIGIATGIVVVGDLVGQGSAQGMRQSSAETPNLAARLQGLAEPEQRRRRWRSRLGAAAGRDFRADAAWPQTLQEPRRAGFSAGRSFARPKTSAGLRRRGPEHGMTPFVGREHEVALLMDRWRDASEGEGQVALITGEAGIGKSRVLTRAQRADRRASRM